MRGSIFPRFLVVTVLVALCSIAATAWLAAHLTRASIEQEQGRELSVDNQIYASLLSYAVSHRDWSGVGPVVSALVQQHPNRRITLLSKEGVPIADVGGRGLLPTTASAVLDPLALDPVLVPDAPADRIDRRVVGPHRVPSADEVANGTAGAFGVLHKCLQDSASVPGVEVGPTRWAACDGDTLPQEARAALTTLLSLEDLVNACLERRQLPPVRLTFGPTAQAPVIAGTHDTEVAPLPFEKETAAAKDVPDRAAADVCVTAARKEQLTSYVPSPALLYVTTPTGFPVASFDLSPANWWRVAAAGGAILLAATVVTALVCARMTRPLRELTTAAHRLSLGGDATALEVRGRDEIAKLTEAFNTMAESRAELERIRKAMVSDTAHELRTPLSNIRGWLEAAEDGLTDRDPELIALLLKEALTLQHVVDDLQDLAIADAGGLRLNPAPLPVGEVLEQSRAAHEARAERARITLTANAPPGLTVSADPLRLRQMLDNLVSNALRHVPEGGRVSITATSDGHRVLIAVTDTGTGISAEDLPHVFDRFWRAEKSRSRSTGGSGLGLAIVRKLAEAQGGTVSARSESGAGSTFTLLLPVAEAPSKP